MVNIDKFDNWENLDNKKNIYEVGITRDFDIVGYVYAFDLEDAKKEALKDKYLMKKSKKYKLRFNKIKPFKATFIHKDLSLEETLEKIKKRRLNEAIRASHNFETLHNIIEQWKKDNINK